MSATISISAAHFRQILEISRMLAVTTDLDALLARIAEATTSLLNCERASIFLHDPVADELVTRVAIQSESIRVPSTAGIVGHVFKSNAVLHVPRPYDDARFNPEPDRRAGFVTRNLLTAPMVELSRQPIGVIQAINTRERDEFTASDLAMIQLLADQAGVAIQRYRLQQSAVDATALRREMELAAEVQQAMIPKHPPKIRGLDVIGWTRPASIAGGDAFDLWETDDGRLGIFVGDASGHGLAPALVVSQTRTMVRAMCNANSDPHALLACANARLNQDLRSGTFVTAFLGFVSSEGELTWSSAGHGPILVWRGDRLHRLPPPAPPLGVVSDFLGKRPKPIQLRPGGSLAVISDGVFEARDENKAQYSVNRLVALLEPLRGGPVNARLGAIQSAMRHWQGSEDPADDQTAVFVQKTG